MRRFQTRVTDEGILQMFYAGNVTVTGASYDPEHSAVVIHFKVLDDNATVHLFDEEIDVPDVAEGAPNPVLP